MNNNNDDRLWRSIGGMQVQTVFFVNYAYYLNPKYSKKDYKLKN